MNSSTRAVRCRLSAQRTVTVSFLTLTLYFADTGHRDKEETGEPDRDGGRDRRSQTEMREETGGGAKTGMREETGGGAILECWRSQRQRWRRSQRR